MSHVWHRTALFIERFQHEAASVKVYDVLVEQSDQPALVFDGPEAMRRRSVLPAFLPVSVLHAFNSPALPVHNVNAPASRDNDVIRRSRAAKLYAVPFIRFHTYHTMRITVMLPDLSATPAYTTSPAVDVQEQAGILYRQVRELSVCPFITQILFPTG